MIKNLKDIETALGLKEGEFKTLYEDKEEKEIPISDFEITPKKDYETRIKNIEKSKYDEGKTVGVETTKKEIREAFGVDFSKKIEIPELKNVISSKIIEDAKIEPDKKVKELQTDLEKMRGNYETEKQSRERIENEFKQKEKTRTINTNVLSLLPKETIIPVEEAAELALRKAASDGIVPDMSESGGIIFKKGDEILKDKNLVPLKADEVLKNYFSPYIKPATGGDGGKDNPGQGGPGSFQAFGDEMATKGIKENSAEFNSEMNKRIANKTLIL
jgi:hypothetical protein